MEYITIELNIGNVGLRLHQATEGPSQLTVAAGHRFSFTLCRKQCQMGDVALDQFWMATSSIYGQRNRHARNFQSIVDYYWAKCLEQGAQVDPETQGTFILAQLVPYARSHGSRRVVADATLHRLSRRRSEVQSWIVSLESELGRRRNEQMNEVEFRDNTGAAIGPRDYDDTTTSEYMRLESELLDEGRRALTELGLAGLRESVQRWQRWMRTISRHRGHEEEKKVLDIFSYEARTALHRCYSAVWCELLPRLVDDYSLPAESRLFHAIWHLQPGHDTEATEARFFLFHGHVFALHPAGGLFLETATGSELMGDWLQNPTSTPAYHRLLNGLLLAVSTYARQRSTIAALREGSSRFVTNYDVETEHADQIGQRRRRRHRKIRSDSNSD